LFTAAYKYDPTNLDVSLSLGYTYASIGKGDETIKHAKEYLNIFPNSWEGHYVLGIGYLYKKDYANSERSLIQAARRNPKEQKILNYLIMLYKKTNHPKKVEKIAKRLAQIQKIK